jgi:hypothetical protein
VGSSNQDKIEAKILEKEKFNREDKAVKDTKE